MPLIHNSSYQAPWLFRSAHLQTIYPALIRYVPLVTEERERIRPALPAVELPLEDLEQADSANQRGCAILEISPRDPNVVDL